MTSDESEPDDLGVDHGLIDLQEFEHDGRLFVTARIAPHPTAIKAVFEVNADDQPDFCPASDLVGQAADPYFWVDVYADLLQDYLIEVHERVESVGVDAGPEDEGPLGQAFEPDSPVGKAARESAIGVRASTATLAEVLLNAMARIGPPRERGASNALLDLFVDATLAASVLEQLSGQPAIPEEHGPSEGTVRHASNLRCLHRGSDRRAA